MGEFFLQKIHSLYSSHIFSPSSRPYLVAEIGLNHNNDMELACRMIQEAAACGADAVKFQSYTTDLFINNQSSEASGLYSIFKNYELGYFEHETLQNEAKSAGIDFFSTPLTVDWVDTLAKMKTPFIKVASGDINNFILLKEIVKKKAPLMVSTGNSNIADIDRVAAFFKLYNKKDVIFLHCISQYPAAAGVLNLSTVSFLSQRLSALTGFSDHSDGAEAAFAAVMLGAVVIEKHFTLDKTLPGPDHVISATPSELREIRRKMDLAALMKGEPRTEAYAEEKGGDVLGKRSLYEVDGKLVPMRPRKQGLPKDSDFFDLV